MQTRRSRQPLAPPLSEEGICPPGGQLPPRGHHCGRAIPRWIDDTGGGRENSPGVHRRRDLSGQCARVSGDCAESGRPD
jgi:hypothetical protein